MYETSSRITVDETSGIMVDETSEIMGKTSEWIDVGVSLFNWCCYRPMRKQVRLHYHACNKHVASKDVWYYCPCCGEKEEVERERGRS